jgi:hypothetical protein
MYTWNELFALEGFIDLFLALLFLIVGLIAGESPLEGLL